MKYVFLFVGISLSVSGYTQYNPKNRKLFQLSLVPGISTNGFHPGTYRNIISINLLSGYSAGTDLLEIGLISNHTELEVRGLQFAGVANTVGINAFAGLTDKEQADKIRAGFEANLTGGQFAGFSNIVITNVFGFQIAGFSNTAGGALFGLQLSGVANVVHKYSFGVQLAGLMNNSHDSMDGVQISTLFNTTTGGLYGIQIGGFNKVGFIEGVNSYANDDPTGLQIGLVNHAKKMNGFQIGLINIGKTMQGTQIGLINIYRGGKDVDTRDGTSIGLLNFGESVFLSAGANELFNLQTELSTGTFKNARILREIKNKYVQNGLIYSKNFDAIAFSNTAWAIGYSLKKYYFNRSSVPGMGEYRFFSYGAEWMHINDEPKKFRKELSLLTRLAGSFGTKLHPKLSSVYVYGALTYNMFWSKDDFSIAPSFLQSEIKSGDNQLEFWPGVSVGVLLH